MERPADRKAKAMRIGQCVRHARQDEMLTRRQLSKKSGIPVPYITAIENGTWLPWPYEILALSKVLNIAAVATDYIAAVEYDDRRAQFDAMLSLVTNLARGLSPEDAKTVGAAVSILSRTLDKDTDHVPCP